ncbi:MAG TPA: protein translocase subunit SecF, partial [Bacteroidia bacterium]
GGRTYTVAFDNTNFDAQKIAEAVALEFEGNEPQVKLFGGNDRVKIISKYKNENTNPAEEEALKERLYNAVKPFFNDAPDFDVFKNEGNGIGLTGAEKVGPSIAGDTRQQSIFAVLASLIIMFIYIMIRFKGPSFGVGATAGLIHNVIVVLGVFSLFNGILPFALEVDQAIIAAVLTVIGYSINDTVVVFDRVREFLNLRTNGTFAEIVNKALNTTLSRTINTSFTTLIVLVVIFLFGGPAIKSMSFALLIGIAVGTYTSVCLAAPIASDLLKKKKNN